MALIFPQYEPQLEAPARYQQAIKDRWFLLLVAVVAVEKQGLQTVAQALPGVEAVELATTQA